MAAVSSRCIPAACLVLLLALLVPRSALAQDDCTAPEPKTLCYHAFTDGQWYSPLIANQRDAHTQALAFARSRRFDFMVAEGNHNIWDISVGREIPIGVWLKGTQAGWIDPGGWAFGLWIPLSFHMVEDFNDDSNPIINNDYRFAGAFKIGHALSSLTVLSGKLQFGHESTHLGDEFTIHALDTYPTTFRRINVSYEYFEFGFNMDRLYGANSDHRLTLRGSGIRTADFLGDPGWYSTSLLDNVTLIPASKRNFEPAVGIELMPEGTDGWRFYGSYEGRLRTVYDYEKQSADQKEKQQFSSTLVIGIRDLSHPGPGIPDFIVKGYYGVNPNGQFRNQANYWMVGIGIYVRI